VSGSLSGVTTGTVRRLLPLYVVVFVGFVGYSLMITVFTPLLLTDNGGILPASASHAQRSLLLGVLLSVYPLGQFLGAPVLGALSDRWGRRPVLIATLTVATAVYVSVGAALLISNLVLLVICTFVGGLFEANISIAQSSLADVTSSADRSRLFGYVYLSSSLAYVVGPLVGGPLADDQVVSWFTPATPFFAVAVLLALTLGAVARWLPETHRPTAAGRPRSNVGTLTAAFTERRFRRIYLTNVLFYLAIFGFFRVYPLYLVDRFALGVTRESEFIAWVAVPIVVANLWLLRSLLRRFTAHALIVAAGTLTGVAMIVVPLPGILNLLWVTLGLTALGLAIVLPLCASTLSEAAGADEQGHVLGANQSLQVGAEAVSGLAGGALAAVVSALPLLVFGGIALVASTLASTRPRNGRTHARATPRLPWWHRPRSGI
jgi:DHA1 family tetracycline resistance protein-like MFS transporter